MIPAGSWICTSPANPLVMKVVDSDESDSRWDCRPVEDLATVAKAGYYIVRTIGFFG